MPIIYCNIQPFVAEQSIYVINDSGQQVLAGKTPLEHLHQVIPEICYNKDCYTVKLICSVEPIAQEMSQNIQKEEVKTYSANKIKIEVD